MTKGIPLSFPLFTPVCKMKESRCVILGRNSSIYWLKELLGEDFSQIQVVENSDQLEKLDSSPPTQAVVGTDTLPGTLLREALVRLQQRLSPRMTLCLVDSLDAATEVELRSLGLCFLGSYITFSKHAEQIFSNARD